MAEHRLITHSPVTGRYQIWSVDRSRPGCSLSLADEGQLDEGYLITRVGGYYLLYDPQVTGGDGAPDSGYVDYMLVDGFTPYPAPLGELKQTGSWYFDKFTGSYRFRETAAGPDVRQVELTGITGYVLSQIQTPGRRSFALWNFDGYVGQPGRSIDPIADSMSDPSAFPTIRAGEKLVPVTNYVLAVDDVANTWRVFSFDPQAPIPLSEPVISEGTLPDGVASERLVAVGDQLYAFLDGSVHQVFTFLPHDPFSEASPITPLPEAMELDASTRLVAGHRRSEAVPEPPSPGTLAYMREKVRHVVVYVLESRSFDNVLGMLYDANTSGSIHWVGATAAPPFQGASASNTNIDGGVTYSQQAVASGRVGPEVRLESPLDDPFHDTPDAIHQQWSGGYAAYQANEPADMGGFVRNNANAAVMDYYVPDQLSVLSGLARGFAVSDMWFCSEAGTTTSNRASIATGSAFDITVSYEGGDAYTYFPDRPRRQSIWKVLANHAIDDWAIYYSVLWEGFPYTYHLYLKGQLPSVDAYPGANVQPIDSFYDAIASGTLPRFSFLEPVWYDPSGVFTSYHPTSDVLPGEAALKKIYDAIVNSTTYRDNTVLVISFSKGGGLYDHVPSQRMAKAWPNDGVDGYDFDTTGTRVPTIVVSPWIQQNTVFRSDNAATPYDGTSLAATILSWFDIPRATWGMGDRIAMAPTFEGVFTLQSPRTTLPTVERAGDAVWPSDVTIPIAAPAPVSNTWAASGPGVWTTENSWTQPTSGDSWLPTDVATFGASAQTQVTFAYIDPQVVNQVHFTADAPAYTLLFDEEQAAAPMLTIAGAGVVNDSGQTQSFVIAASSTSTDQVQLAFVNSASAGANVAYTVGPTTPSSQSGGILAFHQRATAGSASFSVSVGSRPPQGYATVGGEIRFLDDSNAGSATFQASGTTGVDSDTFGNIVFHDRATAGTAQFLNLGGTVGDGGNTQFYEQTSADHATIVNQGGTGPSGNGGDVAFDGTATAANATIQNQAASKGYGGVTSFNNNKPYMSPFAGASAGSATIDNFGAGPGDEGSGGHTEFTGIYGQGDAADATITNHGAGVVNGSSSAGGYTLFAVNGRWPYCQPTAGRATIVNQPAQVAGGVAGGTRFVYQNWNHDGDETKPGPVGGNATITNVGAAVAQAAGGTTLFDGRSSAMSATITSQAGTVAGGGGGTTTFQGEATSDRAVLSATGGVGEPGSIVFSGAATGGRTTISVYGGLLDLHGSTQSSIQLASLATSEATLRYEAGRTALITDDVSFVGTCTFDFTNTTAPSGPVLLLQSEALQPSAASACTGNAIGGLSPTFSVQGDQLLVQFG